MKKETEAERVAETIAALKARVEAVEGERDSLLRCIKSWKREEAEWEKERAGWLVTLDKSEHEGMKWKDRAENAERERSALLREHAAPASGDALREAVRRYLRTFDTGYFIDRHQELEEVRTALAAKGDER